MPHAATAPLGPANKGNSVGEMGWSGGEQNGGWQGGGREDQFWEGEVSIPSSHPRSNPAAMSVWT